MRRLLQVLAILIVLGALAVGGLAWWGNQWLQQPISGLQERTTFEVPRGAHMRSVAAILQERGLLDRPDVWIVWARLMSPNISNATTGKESAALTQRRLVRSLSSGLPP